MRWPSPKSSHLTNYLEVSRYTMRAQTAAPSALANPVKKRSPTS